MKLQHFDDCLSVCLVNLQNITFLLKFLYFLLSLLALRVILRASGIESGPYMGRWYNWGSYEGGFSMYHKHWRWDKDNPEQMGDSDPLYIRYEANKNLVCVSGLTTKRIEPGEIWDSEEFIMTAHTGNWFFGAGPYKEWLHKNVKRVVPMLKRAREMMGFSTVYMANYPNDPADVS